MQKLFSILSITVVLVTLTFGQATVQIPLTAADGISSFNNLAVGLDQAATNCIDPGLGESDLPPFPPLGAFEVRFDLSPANICGQPLSTYWDFRNAPAFPFTGVIEHKLIWQLTTGATTFQIGYTLPLEATMNIKDPFGGGLFNSGTLTGTGTYTVPAAFIGLNAAIVTMSYTSVPVELTSFTGIVQDNGVLLNWTTATELNNKGFEVERSSAAQSWEKIGFVSGNGSTTEPQAYSYLDETVTNGTFKYRLKQVDFSGTFEYSPEIEVDVDFTPSNFELSQNYPNPFNPSTTIQFQLPEASDVSIVIFDMLGQKVKSLFSENVQAGSYSVDWNGINDYGIKMSSGSYIYRMTAGDFVDTKEMILLK